MEDNTLRQLGGTCSILAGITILLAAIIYLLLPPELQESCRCPEKFLASVAQNPTPRIAEYLPIALYSLLAIAAVLAISENVRSANEGWTRWTSTLAIIGLAVNAIVAFNHVALDPDRAAVYMQGDTAVKAALTVPGALESLDPQAWLRYGAFGLWALVVSLLARRRNIWPQSLTYMGIGVAIAAWLVVAGEVFPSQSLIALIAGVASILVPIWYIWLGLSLRKIS